MDVEPITAIVLINVERGKVKEVAKELSKIDEVTKVHSVAGIYDFIVKVKVKEYGSVKNVVELIEYTKPNAVDVILGVETSGRKDERKVREFVKAAKVI